MKMDGKEEFILKLKQALGVSESDNRDRLSLFIGKGPEKAAQDLAKIRSRTREEKLKLLDQLIVEAKPLNLCVKRAKDAAEAASFICQLVKNTSPFEGNKKSVVLWEDPLIERLELQRLITGLNVPVYKTVLGGECSESEREAEQRSKIRKQIFNSYIGITTADYCIAEAATLAMKTRPGQARSVSLVPSIHIVVIEIDQLIADVAELYTILKYDQEQKEKGLTNVMTLISGPSKTADIELVMVHGAHGPRELHLFVITG